LNSTAKAFLRQGRGRLIALLASGALLGSMLAAGLAVASPAAANEPEGDTTGPSGAAGAAATLAVAGGLSAFFAPSTVCAADAAGAAQPFTLTVAVTSLPASRALRTLFITVPKDYAVSGVTASVGTPSVLTDRPAYIRVGGLNLSTTPGSNSVTVKFSSTTPAGGPTNWGLEGETGTDRRPDNDTATPNGDDFTAAKLPTTTVAVGCHLVFTAQPADAGKGQNVTSVALTPGGTPAVTVAVEDSSSPTPLVVPVAVPINLALAPTSGTLSGGERRMLSIGMGLLRQPKLLMLDEPSSGLSPVAFQNVANTIRKINVSLGTAVILVEQNVKVAFKLSRRVYVMKAGRMILEETGEKLLQRKEWWDLF